MMRESEAAAAVVRGLVEAIAGVSAGVDLERVADLTGLSTLALGRVRNGMDKVPFAAAAAMAAAGGHALVCGVGRVETGPVAAVGDAAIVEGVANAQARRAAVATTVRTVHAVSVYTIARSLGLGQKVVRVMENEAAAPFLHSVIEHLALFGLGVGLVPAAAGADAARSGVAAAGASAPVSRPRDDEGGGPATEVAPDALGLALKALGSERGSATRVSSALATIGRRGHRVAVLAAGDAEAANMAVVAASTPGRPAIGGCEPVGQVAAALRLGATLRAIRVAGDPRVKATARAVGVDYRSINEVEGSTGNVRLSYLADYLARFGLGLAVVGDPEVGDATAPAIDPTAALPRRKPTHNPDAEALRAGLVRRFHREVLGTGAHKARATVVEVIAAARAAGVGLALRDGGRIVHRVGLGSPEDEVRSLVARLSERRRLSGLSARDVAERSGVGRTTIEFFEADHRAREIELGVMLRYLEAVGHELGEA